MTAELTADRDSMDHFRAIAAAGEKSERALELTETIIRMNPAHYTVWYVERYMLADRIGSTAWPPCSSSKRTSSLS